MAAFLFNPPNPRRFNARNYFDECSDSEIIERYRLSRPMIDHLTDLLRPDLQRASNRNHSVDPKLQVLMTLRLLGKGDFLSEVADLHGCSKSTVSRCLWTVISSINQRLDNIRFPVDERERNETKMGFYRIARIPGVLGAVDGTLIPILAPSEDEYAYVCRKGFHALNVQAVVSYDMRFIDCVCRWPGSQHDAWIFNHCALKDHLELTKPGHLLGDSGYPLKEHLMTPKQGPLTQQEQRYNIAHGRTRVVVEKAFGVLKSRFRCLHKSGGTLMYTPGKSAALVEACFRLHNMCIDHGLPHPNEMEDNPECDDVQYVGTMERTASHIRQSIINLF